MLEVYLNVKKVTYYCRSLEILSPIRRPRISNTVYKRVLSFLMIHCCNIWMGLYLQHGGGYYCEQNGCRVTVPPLQYGMFF